MINFKPSGGFAVNVPDAPESKPKPWEVARRARLAIQAQHGSALESEQLADNALELQRLQVQLDSINAEIDRVRKNARV